MHPKDTHTHTHQQELHPMHSKDTHTSMSFIIGNPNTHTHTHQCELHPVHTKDARHEWPCVNAHTNSQSCPCIHSLCAAKSDGQEHGQPRVILSAQIWPATSDPISTDLASHKWSYKHRSGQPRVILSAQIWPATSDPTSKVLSSHKWSYQHRSVQPRVIL